MLRLIIFLLIFLFPFLPARAAVVINEIMYDLDGSDTDREWIEVMNSGGSAVDLSSWKFFEANTNHGLTISQGDPNLPASGFAIIADSATKFLEDHAGFSGLLFDSSFSLSNTGEDLALKDEGGIIIDQITYNSSSGAAGDGNSLQKIGGNWVAAAPTPGAANSGDGGGGSNGEDGEDGGGTSGGGAAITTTTQPAPVYKIAVDIVSKTTAVAGVPVDFLAKAAGLGGEPLYRGKFTWNMGDGFAKTESEAQKFFYTYSYPGDYLIILEYCSSSYYCPAPDAIDRQLIKVLPASVTISAAGLLDGASVELTNSSGLEADLGRWTLDGAAHDFILAPNTLILAGKKLVLPARVIGFSANDLTQIYLRLPGGEVVSEYPAPNPPLAPVIQEPGPEKLNSKEIQYLTPEPVNDSVDFIPLEAPPPEENLEPLGEDLAAAALLSGNEDRKSKTNSWPLAVGGIVVLAIVSYFLFKRPANLADRFKILDK